MTQAILILQIVLIAIIALLGAYNWIYRAQAEKIEAKLRLEIPSPVKHLLQLGIILPPLSVLFILIYLIFRA